MSNILYTKKTSTMWTVLCAKLFCLIHCSYFKNLFHVPTEPYNHSERRGRKQPEAASIKRLFVENRPYLISGCRRNGPWADVQLKAQLGLKSNYVRGASLPVLASAHQYSSMPQVDGSRSFMSDKYEHMRATFRKRLAFGKLLENCLKIFRKCE